MQKEVSDNIMRKRIKLQSDKIRWFIQAIAAASNAEWLGLVQNKMGVIIYPSVYSCYYVRLGEYLALKSMDENRKSFAVIW